MGILVGLGDPETGVFRALINANTVLRAGGDGEDTVTFVGQALGKMEAEVTGGGIGTIQRIEGTAHLDLFLGGFEDDLSVLVSESFDFIVDGFQQSAIPTGASSSFDDLKDEG